MDKQFDSERFYGELWRLYGVPVELSPDTTKRYYTWDPHRGSVMIERDVFQDNELTYAAHEVCHFIVATRVERRQPEFGLGQNGGGHRPCRRTVNEASSTVRESLSSELMAYVAWRILMLCPELTEEALAVIRFSEIPAKARAHAARALRAFEPEGLYVRSVARVRKIKERLIAVAEYKRDLYDCGLCTGHSPYAVYNQEKKARIQRELAEAQAKLEASVDAQRKLYMKPI